MSARDDHPGTTTHRRRVCFWRLQLEFLVYIHHYPTSSDRWVFRPGLVYDRKQRSKADLDLPAPNPSWAPPRIPNAELRAAVDDWRRARRAGRLPLLPVRADPLDDPKHPK